jgi:hypothetical protein
MAREITVSLSSFVAARLLPSQGAIPDIEPGYEITINYPDSDKNGLRCRQHRRPTGDLGGAYRVRASYARF